MGLYHTVNIVYGARIDQNEMNPNLHEDLEQRYDETGVELFTLGDGDEYFLVIESRDLDPNEFMRVSDFFLDMPIWHNILVDLARDLDVEIDKPGWYALHDYS